MTRLQGVASRCELVVGKRSVPDGRQDVFGGFLAALPSKIQEIVFKWMDCPDDAGGELGYTPGHGPGRSPHGSCPQFGKTLQDCIDRRLKSHLLTPVRFMDAAVLYTEWGKPALLDQVLSLLEPLPNEGYWDGQELGWRMTPVWRSKALDWSDHVCELASRLTSTTFTIPLGTGDVYKTARNGKSDGRHIEFEALSADRLLALLFWIFRHASCTLTVGEGGVVHVETRIDRVDGLPLWCRSVGVGILEGNPEEKVALGALVTPHAGILQAGLLLLRRLNGLVKHANRGLGYVTAGSLQPLSEQGWRHCFNSSALLALGIPFHHAWMAMPKGLKRWQSARRKLNRKQRLFAHAQIINPVGFKLSFNVQSGSLGFVSMDSPDPDSRIPYHGKRHTSEAKLPSFPAELTKNNHTNVAMWSDYSHVLPQIYLGMFTALPALWAVIEADRQEAGLPPFAVIRACPPSIQTDSELLSFLEGTPLMNMPISNNNSRHHENRQLWAVGGMPQASKKKSSHPPGEHDDSPLPVAKRRRK